MSDLTSLPVEEAWFTIEQMDPTILRLVEPPMHRWMRANFFYVIGRDRDLLVDAGNGFGDLMGFLKRHGLATERPVTCVLTHGDIDHIGFAHLFEERLIHPLEAEFLARDWGEADFNHYHEKFNGFINAVPRAGFTAADWRLPAAPATRLIDEGDVVTTGDRTFEVLHLPGHTHGSVGLFERATGILIAGDAIYDGILSDEHERSDKAAYRKTMERLRDLPITVVHGGHRMSFGPARHREIIDGYLNGTGSIGTPASVDGKA